MDGSESLTSPDRVSNTSALASNNTVVVVADRGGSNRGGAVITPAPDTGVISVYRPPHQRPYGDQGFGGHPTDRNPDTDRGLSYSSGRGNSVASQLLMTNPRGPEYAAGFPPPFASYNPTSIPSRSLPVAQTLQFDPPISGPVPNRVTQPRAGHTASSHSQRRFNPHEGTSTSSSQQVSLVPHKDLVDDISHLHSRIHGLCQGTLMRRDLPESFLQPFNVDITEITSGLIGVAEKVNRLVTRLEGEKDDVLGALQRLQIRDNGAASELAYLEDYRRAISHEMDKKDRALHEQILLNKKLESKLVEAERKVSQCEHTIAALEKTEMCLRDQIDGKRSLWLDVHKEPRERAWITSQQGRSQASASIVPSEVSRTGSLRPSSRTAWASKFEKLLTPSGAGSVSGQHNSQLDPTMRPFRMPQGPVSGTRFGASLASRSDIRSHSMVGSEAGGYPNRSRCQEVIISGTPNSRHQSVLFDPHRPDALPTTTEAGSPQKQVSRQMSVSDLQIWANKFTKIWFMTRAICAASGIHITKDDLVAHIKSKSPELWKSLCQSNSQAQDQASSEANATALLRDTDARLYLIERFILQVLLEKAFHLTFYAGFSADTDEDLKKVSDELDENGSKPPIRATLLQRQRAILTQIRSSPKWTKFRLHRLQQLYTDMKNMVWTLFPIDNETVRRTTDYDIHSLTEKALDLAGDAVMSEHDFGFGWHRSGEVFTSSSHELVKGGKVEGNEADWRVKLGITPSVTARQMEGMSILPRLVLKAQVLAVRAAGPAEAVNKEKWV